MIKSSLLIVIPIALSSIGLLACHHHHDDRHDNGWHGTNPRPAYNHARQAVKKTDKDLEKQGRKAYKKY